MTKEICIAHLPALLRMPSSKQTQVATQGRDRVRTTQVWRPRALDHYKVFVLRLEGSHYVSPMSVFTPGLMKLVLLADAQYRAAMDQDMRRENSSRTEGNS